MQLSPATQSRLWFKFNQYRKTIRKQKQDKRIEEQKQYMQLLRKRKEQEAKEKRIPRPTNDGDTITYHSDILLALEQRNKTTIVTLSTTCKSFIGSYLIFLFAAILFFITPGLDKQLLGHQFYQIIEATQDITTIQSTAINRNNQTNQNVAPKSDHTSLSLEVGAIAVVKRTPFIALDKTDIFIYENRQQRARYHVGQIKSIDVANYQVSILKDGEPHIIPKDQIKGIVVRALPDYTTEGKQTIAVLSYSVGLLLVLLLIQVSFYVLYVKQQKDEQHTRKSKHPRL